MFTILSLSWGVSYSRFRLENIINQRFDEIRKRLDEVKEKEVKGS